MIVNNMSLRLVGDIGKCATDGVIINSLRMSPLHPLPLLHPGSHHKTNQISSGETTRRVHTVVPIKGLRKCGETVRYGRCDNPH